jgi:hypothetical protein
MDAFTWVLTKVNSVKPLPVKTVDDIIDEPMPHGVQVTQLSADCKHAYTTSFLRDPFSRFLCWVVPVWRCHAQWKATEAQKAHEVAISQMKKTFHVTVHSRVQEYYTRSSEFANMTLDDRLAFVCTNGIAAHLVVSVDGVGNPVDDQDTLHDRQVVDLRFLRKYSVRKGYRPYGARLHLRGLRATHIELNSGRIVGVAEGYNQFMATLIAFVTVAHHAVGTHFCESGRVNAAFSEQWHTLPSDFVSLLRVFLFNTSKVNSRALNILTCRGGIVSRLFAFTEEGLQEFIRDSFTHFNPSDLWNFHERTNVAADARNFREVLSRFVNWTVDAMFPDNIPHRVKKFVSSVQQSDHCVARRPRDKLVKMLNHFIFSVTFGHEYIGNMSLYILDPRACPVKVHQGQPLPMQNKRDTYQSSFLALFTQAVRMPTIVDNLYLSQPRQYHVIWKKWQQEMMRLEASCWSLDIRNIECAVSL